MPEGDDVWRTAARMQAALAGKRLAASDFRVPSSATLDLSGWTVVEVVSRGKHLLHRLAPPEQAPPEPAPPEQAPPEPAPPEQAPPEPAPPEQAPPTGSPAPLSIHSHLKMEGSWQVYGPGDRWRKPAHTARVVLTAQDGTSAVGFSLGVLEVLPTAEEGRAVGHLGPDLLGPDWDAALAEANLRERPERAIGLALLDQRNLAGIGNIYRNELCFLSRVHPAAPVRDVPDLAGLVATAHRLLGANRSRPSRNTTGGFGPRGDSWVYGGAGQPCGRCRTRIVHATLGEPPESAPGAWPGEQRERDIYFCPSCQPAP